MTYRLRETLTDDAMDRVLRAPVPGGSSVRDWMLPFKEGKGADNIRDVLRIIVVESLGEMYKGAR